MIKQLLQQVNSLTSTVDSLNATINTQTQLIVQLNQTIQELKEQLNKNSKNSSKPPSSDGYKKPAPKSLRKPSGKKVGGQDGHQGTHLAVITAPDEIVIHMPSACKGCRMGKHQCCCPVYLNLWQADFCVGIHFTKKIDDILVTLILFSLSKRLTITERTIA